MELAKTVPIPPRNGYDRADLCRIGGDPITILEEAPMADRTPQSFENHAKIVPAYHVVLMLHFRV